MEQYELPEGWEWRALGDHQILTDIQPGYACGKKDVEGGAIHLRMNNISKTGTLDWSLIRRIPTDVAEKSKKWLQPGDVIFNNTNSTELVGKSCLFLGWSEPCAFSNHLTRLRCHLDHLLPEWLHYCLRDLWLMGFFAANCKEFVGQSAFNTDKLKEVEIPIPPLPEQNRLVARIEAFAQRLEASRKEQQEAISMASAYFNLLCQRTYRELLETCITISLCESGNIMGGGTPSKDNAAFWKGDIPWIAPKEMKRWHIGESSLTITESAINQSAAHLIPAPAVLFVVRGMILARTVPVAISTCSLTVNQDMKAIVPRQKLSAEFLAYMLLGAQPELLSMVEVAGHGTRKLESDRWGSLPIPLPDSSKQTLIVQRLETMRRKADELTAVQRAAESDLAALMPAILAKAFRGEL